MPVKEVKGPLGSCPDCGGNIWEQDKISPGTYQCIRCGRPVRIDEIIPF